MARLVAAIAALLSFVSLVLVAISMATNFWVRFEDRAASDGNVFNPIIVNSDFLGLSVEYDVDYFGLWVGCHLARTFDKISCGYIGSSCYSNICWVRNEDDKKCKDSLVTPISDCAAYQATRAMTIIGTLFLIAGSSILVVSVCIASKALPTSGAICTFLGGLFLMIAFAVFYQEIFRDLREIAGIGWSYILLIVAWPLAVVAGLIGMTALFGGSKDAEEADYEESD